MEELWDIYDIHRRKTGRLHDRHSNKPLNKGEYHVVVDIWTKCGDKILLSKRHPNKIFGGMWECTGGAVLTGEDSLTGAMREVKEETGIMPNPDSFKCIGTIIANNAIYDTYVNIINPPIPVTVPQEGETVEFKWLTIDEIDEYVKSGIIVPSLSMRFDVLYRKKIMLY